ncbi:697_t:CDS:2 [Rhizophagus irregularis]|nr:697_t:CDS:2 [Rhizophagus irregularis]
MSTSLSRSSSIYSTPPQTPSSGTPPPFIMFTDPAKAINYYENYGPSFGRNDLKMSGNFKAELKCCCKQGDYEFPIRNDTNSFSIDEYE